MTGKNRGLAHCKCSINVTHDQSNFLQNIFHNFSSYNCYLFIKKLFDKKKNKVNFIIIPKTNEEYNLVRLGCIRFIDSYQFLYSSLDSSIKAIFDNSHETLKVFEEKIVDNDEILNIVNEIKTLNKEVKYENDSIET